MNKYILLLSFIFMFVVVKAQEDKYLAGTVPVINGKVLFEKSIVAKEKISEDQLFSLLDKWARQNYEGADSDPNNRILLSDASKNTIACAGEKNLVFKKSALILDQAKMTYQLILEIENQKCNVTIRGIRYDYSDSKDLQPAESLITDEIAINKKDGKLNRYYDKFRIHTIDSVNSIFRSIDVYLNGINTAGAISSHAVSTTTPHSQIPGQELVSSPVVQDKKEQINQSLVTLESQSTLDKSKIDNVPVGVIHGYKQIGPDQIPGNYIKILSDWTLITSGTPNQMNVMTASWGGIGTFWDKPAVFCFLNPERYSVQTMDEGDTYTISFYTQAYKDNLRYCGSVSGRTTDKIKGSGLTPIKTPSGATAFSEAWMIIECKKIVSQQLSSDAVIDKSSLADDWSKNGYHKMYIGEILSVWIKKIY